MTGIMEKILCYSLPAFSKALDLGKSVIGFFYTVNMREFRFFAVYFWGGL